MVTGNKTNSQLPEIAVDIRAPLMVSGPPPPADGNHEFQAPARNVLHRTSCCCSPGAAKSCLDVTLICGFIGSLATFAGGWIAYACDAPENVSAGMIAVSSALLTCCCISCCVSQR
jgi:hypothetical protein